jgi:pimeloyl-ACP methyl ester carboxylesterase
MPFVRGNGLDIAYEVRGAGPPLVALHGATSLGLEDYAAQLPLLSKGFLIHVPEARGHGRTLWDAADGFRYDWLVDDLVAFVDALGLDSFHLLGFSMGAMTALQFGARFPERLRTLVVVGITTQREPRASVGKRLMDPARILSQEPAFAATLARRHDAGQGDGAWQRLLPAIAADIALQPLLTPAQLHAIDCPAMVVCGDRDPFVPPEHASALARQLPSGHLFVAPNCGHEVPARRPGLFNEAVSGFYRSTEADARARAERAENRGNPAVAPAPATPDSAESGDRADPEPAFHDEAPPIT